MVGSEKINTLFDGPVQLYVNFSNKEKMTYIDVNDAKVEMLDCSGLMRLASNISLLKANKPNESACIFGIYGMSLTLAHSEFVWTLLAFVPTFRPFIVHFLPLYDPFVGHSSAPVQHP